MDTQKFVGLLVFGLIGVIVLSAFVPIISETTSATKTFENNGYFRMSEVKSTDENTVITWDSADAFVFNVNGNDIELPAGATSGNVYPYTILATDEWALRVAVLNDAVNVDLTLYGSGADSTLIWFVNSWSNDTARITLASGTASFVANESEPVTLSYTSVFILDSNGEYILKKSTESAYLHGDSLIYATGRTTASFGGDNVDLNINIKGNITNGETVTILAPTGFTSDNVDIHKSSITGYVDLFKFDNVTFDIIETESNTSIGAIYSQVIVPYQVTAEKAVHPDDALSSIIDLLPVIAGLGLFIILVAEFLYSRYL